MSERRFYIAEIDENDGIYKNAEAITESMLRRRAIQMFNAQWTCADDVRIDILLHGEGEKGEVLMPKTRDRYRCNSCYYEGSVPCPQHSHLYAKEVSGLQDQPTIEKWLEWIARFPNWYKGTNHAGITWSVEVRGWFLSMPIVPKD